MSRVDLKLGFACNNRCLFCVQGDKRERHGPRSMSQIHADLTAGRQRGTRALVLTGGEPTVQPHFLAALRLAARLGYRSIQIQTNGRLFAYEKLCHATIEAGATEFSPALHAATADVHDRLTRAPGSWEQSVAGIRNLVRLGQTVLTNTVITSLGYRQTPQLARLLVSLGVQQMQLAFVHIVGTAADNSHWLVPRKSEVMPYVFAGLQVAIEAGVRCMTEAIPFCLMGGHEQRVAERIIPPTLIYDADKTIDDYGAYRRDQGKLKGPACPACAWSEQCEGPWREYPELFGWDELRPVAADGPPAPPMAAAKAARGGVLP
jgi:pyruvate-formate lyase-activating enzyme